MPKILDEYTLFSDDSIRFKAIMQPNQRLGFECKSEGATEKL